MRCISNLRLKFEKANECGINDSVMRKFTFHGGGGGGADLMSRRGRAARGPKNGPYVRLILADFCFKIVKKVTLRGTRKAKSFKNCPHISKIFSKTYPAWNQFSNFVFLRPYEGLSSLKKGTLTSGTSPYPVLPKYPPGSFHFHSRLKTCGIRDKICGIASDAVHQQKH